jgi:hypothetical protein
VEDRDLLAVAALLHDIGYSPDAADTGLHQLDGARYLARQGFAVRLCALVAHHSAAEVEAEERGLSDELAVWPREKGPVADALWAADMTTGLGGESVDYPSRLAEILDRYSADSPVARAMSRARPTIEAAIGRARAQVRTNGFRSRARSLQLAAAVGVALAFVLACQQTGGRRCS